MKNLLNPRWLFFINTLPIVVLFFLLFAEFNIIKSLLTAQNIELWIAFGATLGILACCQLVYAVYLNATKQKIPTYYSIVALVLYVLWLMIYASYSTEVVPTDIPQWMLPNDPTIYPFTFLMPTLAHAMFVLVDKSIIKGKAYSAFENLAIPVALVVSIPISVFIFGIVQYMWADLSQHIPLLPNLNVELLCSMLAICAFVVLVVQTIRNATFHKIAAVILLFPLAIWCVGIVLRPLNFQNNLPSVLVDVTWAVVWIGTIATFFFFLIRAIYISMINKSGTLEEDFIAWKVFIALVLPLVGLLLNNFGTFNTPEIGIFGNFSGAWFYILAIVNGVFVCISTNYQSNRQRLWLFAARWATLPYTLYFFLVFLPYLPLSVLLIIVFATGLLTLAPLVLMIVHASELSDDYEFLQQHYAKNKLLVIAFAAFMLIPTGVTLSYWQDKRTLTQTLDYLYTPDYSKQYQINKASLAKTLAVIKQHKTSIRQVDPFFNSTGGVPYLSTYFNWLVLNNMTLSEAKINTIENVFYGESTIDKNAQIERWNGNNTSDVVLSNINIRSHFDEQQHAWLSWVDLDITNNSQLSNTEYQTSFELPAGCWISDYYLYVKDKKEMGLLAERKSAAWVYQQIKNIERRDPGMLSYYAGNKIDFRVFPFDRGETRKTGIEFIHKEPTQISIDGKQINLGDNTQQINLGNTTTPNKQVRYVSAAEKTTLKKVVRTPYYHFIVDVSAGSEKYKPQYAQQIQTFLAQQNSYSNAQISFTNTYTTTSALNNNWKEQLQTQTCEGGFYADRAIRKVLFDAYQNKSATYPVIVVVSNDFEAGIIEKDFSDMAITYPETDLFYEINTRTEALITHSLSNKPQTELSDYFSPNEQRLVLAYPNEKTPIAYLPNNNKASIVLKNGLVDEQINQSAEKNWETALLMQGQIMSDALHPETSNRNWLTIIKNSFSSKIMTPLTSYIVVENEAQKAMILSKQKQVLASNQSLDLGEETLPMSEPSLWWLLFLLGIVWVGRRISK